MINYTCLSAIEKLLVEAPELSIFRNGSYDIHFVSTWLPSHSDSPYGGLEEAIRIRLSNPDARLILLSFSEIEIIKEHDKFGIVDLKGTHFLRLPFGWSQSTILSSECVTPLKIPEYEWKRFLVNVCTSYLKEEISKLRHGEVLAIGNTILYPLRAACVAYSQYPTAYTQVIHGQLIQLQKFFRKEELSCFLFFADKAKKTSDDYLDKVTAFVSLMNDLAENAGKNDLKVNELLIKVDKFILIFNALIDT